MEKESQGLNREQFTNRLRSMFYTMVGVPLLLFVLAYLNVKHGTALVSSGWIEKVRGIIILLSMVVPIIAYIFYIKTIKRLRGGTSLKDKLNGFYTACKKLYLTLSITSILSVVLLTLTQDMLYAGVYIFLLVITAMNNPTELTIYRSLAVSKDEF